MAGKVAVVAFEDRRKAGQAVGGVGVLSAAEGAAGGGHAAAAGGVGNESAPTAPDVQKPIPGAKVEFLADQIELGDLRFFERRFRRAEVRAGVSHEGVEKEREELVRTVIVKADIAGGLAAALVGAFESRGGAGEEAEEAFAQTAAVAPALEAEGGDEVALETEISAHEGGADGVEIGGEQAVEDLPVGDATGHCNWSPGCASDRPPRRLPKSPRRLTGSCPR